MIGYGLEEVERVVLVWRSGCKPTVCLLSSVLHFHVLTRPEARDPNLHSVTIKGFGRHNRRLPILRLGAGARGGDHIDPMLIASQRSLANDVHALLEVIFDDHKMTAA